jgi:ribulose-5-phosphate 4-epimerase/fuculose-1-phosphate aldolase
MMNEGYVKYTAEHIQSPAFEPPLWGELNRVRTRLHDLGLIGMYPNGIGYGNVSIRLKENEFLITGTATGARRILTVNEYCLVTSIDIAANRITSSGPVKASAESMTHGAIYRSCPEAVCVIHIHNLKIFNAMLCARFLSTPAEAAYGTPEMAYAIGECVRQAAQSEGTIVLTGHEEGVISYGVSVESALNLIEELYRKFAAA